MIVRRFLSWVQSATPGERAEGVSALARTLLYADLSPEDRREAETALTAMLDDPSPLVRRAMAEAFANAAEAPAHLVLALANDQSDVAALVLARSPLLDDHDLVDCAALGDEVVQAAVASRPRVSAAVAAALAEIAGPQALAVLVENHDAAVTPASLARILGEVVSAAGRTQLRMAETEKYPHVTYFLNGGEETLFPGEERIMAPSPKVATYDLQPEMSAPELTEKAVAAIRSGTFDLIVLNFANADMVGHTGSLAAAIRAVETVDAGLGRIVDAVGGQGGAVLITADHGNAELMRDPVTGGPHTAHTTIPVPVLLAGVSGATLHDGRLADLAPTLLALMGLPQPPEMTGRSLLG